MRLLDAFPHKHRKLGLVFECMEADLEDLIKDKGVPLAGGDVKAYMHMLLDAVAFIHDQGVLHRDM